MPTEGLEAAAVTHNVQTLCNTQVLGDRCSVSNTEKKKREKTRQADPGRGGGEHRGGGDVLVGGEKRVRAEEEKKYGCKERGKVTFMAQRRADTSSPWLRKATEVSC